MNRKPRIGIIGGFQNGKSTLVNCLLDGKAARTGGRGIAVTSVPVIYRYGEYPSASLMCRGEKITELSLSDFLASELPEKVDEVIVSYWRPLLQHIDLVDTPGFKASDTDDDITMAALPELDLAVVLLNNKGLDSHESRLFRLLHEFRKPFLVLVNCLPQGGSLWDPLSPQNAVIISEIEGRIASIGGGFLPANTERIICCNLQWFWYAAGHHQTYDLELSQALSSQVDFYFEHFLPAIKENQAAIATRSGFAPVRALLEERAFGFPLNFLQWRSTLDRAIFGWETQVKETLKKLKS